MHAQLGQQAVVARADDVTAVDAGIDAHAGPARPAHREHAARGRKEAAVGVLGVDARLDGVTAQEHVALLQVERSPCGDLELAADDVDARDQLGDGVLDLDARIHLQEVPAAVGSQEELGSAGPGVADDLGEPQSRGAELAPELPSHAGRGRLLDHLLVAPLHRAVTLAQVQPATVGVAQDLHLDVPCAVDVALVEQAAVAERRLGLACGRLDGGRQLGGVAHDAHAAPAAARSRLDQQRIAELAGVGAAGDDGHSRSLCELARRVLAAERGERFDRRANERRGRRPCRPRPAPATRTGSRSPDAAPARRRPPP